MDYNAAILFKKGDIVDTYRKIRLVPFTESFPFKTQLPGIYQWLKDADTHFWKQGTEYVVFDSSIDGKPGVRFSTPICSRIRSAIRGASSCATARRCWST